MRRSGTLALLALSSLLISSAPAFAQDSDTKSSDRKEASIEDMRSHRQTMRDDLFLPSLKGIRGLAFGMAGAYPDGLELDKALEGRLKQLPILVKKYEELEPGVTKPIDGVLQIKCLGAGPRHAMVELTLSQWTSLVRDPSISSRTITYTDQAVCHRSSIKETAVHLINQFIIDFQKANAVSAKPSESTELKQASDETSGKKKKSKNKKS